MSLVRFPEISPRAWEHPTDRAALDAMRHVPGFDVALKAVFGFFTERALRLVNAGGSVEVGPNQYPAIHTIYEEVLSTLDAPKRPQLFVTANPVMNAGAVGLDEPFIVLNSGIVHGLSPDQLRSVLGHELGHVMSGHVLYKTMLRILLRAGTVAMGVPLAGIPLLALIAALLEWDRKSELSADRAGLLACQSPEVVRGSLLRLAGGVAEGSSIEAFREQARRYEEEGTPVDSLFKTIALLGQTHPFPVLRMRELDRWIEGGEYQKILDGHYPRRGEDPQVKVRSYVDEVFEKASHGAEKVWGRLWPRGAKGPKKEGPRGEAGAEGAEPVDAEWIKPPEGPGDGPGKGEDDEGGGPPPGDEGPPRTL